MNRIIFFLALFLMVGGLALPSANAATSSEPLPPHQRISNSPYVLLNDGKALYHTTTGERIPLTRDVTFNRFTQVDQFVSPEGDYLVFTERCTDCSSTLYVVGLDGTVQVSSFPEHDRLIGADIGNDRLFWYLHDGKTVATTLDRDVIWEKNLGASNVSLTADGKTILAATDYLERIEHVSAETGETRLTRTLPKQDVLVKKPLSFQNVTIYTVYAHHQAHYIYNEVTGNVTLTTRNESYTNYAMTNGAVHWFHNGAYSVYDVAAADIKTYPVAVSMNVFPETIVFSDGERLALSEYRQLPQKLELFVDKQANEPGDATLYVNRSYPIFLKETRIDGTEGMIPLDRLTPTYTDSGISSPLRTNYATSVSYNMMYKGVKFSGTLHTKREGTVTVQQYGMDGEIIGEATPRAYITIEAVSGGQPVTYTGRADAGGRFHIPTDRLVKGTPLVISSTDSTTVAYQKRFAVTDGIPLDMNITVVGDNAETGVAFKTVPHGKISLFVKERYHSYYETVQADANGIFRVTDSVDPLTKGVQFYYRPFGGPVSSEKVLTIFERAEPEFTLRKTLEAGDLSIGVTTTTRLVTTSYYVNDVLMGTGGSLLHLEQPLQPGDVVRVVMRAGDRTKTIEHQVAAVGPTILEVTDVAMTATHTVVNVRRDTRAELQFFINGKMTTATPVSTTRFTIPAKPGDIVLVRLVRNGQKLDTRLALPQVTFSNIRLHDEQTTWVGMVLPNSNVTLQNGTRQIASGKSSSTGRVVMSLAPQPLNAKITLVSTRGVYRFVQTVNVKAGLTPVMTVAAPTSTTRTVTVNSNVDYGTVTIHRGTTLLATKTVTSKSTPVAIAAQKAGTRLTIKLTTPKGRTQTVYVTVR